MKFTNLRLIGFKSFVDTTDLDIREGLTGVVGPNGCGKSNLLEALRWVMGATSAKALRSGGMADVIFSGTAMRPARNWAEVVLTLDNSDRSAPAEYNDASVIEISRRIIKNEDGANSIYRINGKDARAKDVQLLFADASTGANSPALVRQGQISELINAKPENRRRLLEEAAGVTGLHSRRHEAELRLRAAEQNLSRLDDVTGELEGQKTALARQARQATRYRNLSGDIRRAEASVAYVRWQEAITARDDGAKEQSEIGELVEETARAAAAASVAETETADRVSPLREKEAETGAALHRLTVARENLEEEAARARAEVDRLSRDIESFTGDLSREEALAVDAREALETLARETENLSSREVHEKTRLETAEQDLSAAEETLRAHEQAFEEKNARAAEIEAERRALNGAVQGAERRLERIRQNITALEKERTDVQPSEEQATAFQEAQSKLAAAEEAVRGSDLALSTSESQKIELEEHERRLRRPMEEAAKAFAELRAECDALSRVLGAQNAGEWPALIEEVTASEGYETALAAALGDDLDAALSNDAPAFWSGRGSNDPLPELPQGAAPLSRYVQGPAAIRHRLEMIGVVDAELGARLAASLAPGQRLVSRNGDLWRWDGFVKRAEAKTAAAIRLEQRNRLAHLSDDLEDAQAKRDAADAEYAAAAEKLKQATARDKEARNLSSLSRKAYDTAQSELLSLERAHERTSNRLKAISESLERAQEEIADNDRQISEYNTERSKLPEAAALASEVAESREALGSVRAAAAEARAAHKDLSREKEMRTARIQELARETGVWRTRAETAATRTSELKERLETAKNAHSNAESAPEAIEEKKRGLLSSLAQAEDNRKEAADALAIAVNEAETASRTSKAAQSAAAEAREARARIEAQFESASERVADAVAHAAETCNAAPEELAGIAEFKDPENIPPREDLERKLERYKRERENLGGVNLRADEELKEISERLDEITVEREDCEAAIRKLRAAIGSINREARERLNSAFETVNANFSSLFTKLFNGGQAELRLIESEDVLEAGLEIFASPPGKKLTSMSLMSGGEQALTATALIFAVFMANPAPVCVLDEVDAPLDDANTERFCRLLHQMAKETETRFLVITHHALTMSRMNRLFGVTMMERGVSQLVSVDLQYAEQLVAAE